MIKKGDSVQLVIKGHVHRGIVKDAVNVSFDRKRPNWQVELTNGTYWSQWVDGGSCTIIKRRGELHPDEHIYR